LKIAVSEHPFVKYDIAAKPETILDSLLLICRHYEITDKPITIDHEK
jgi:hypothetical protein